MKIALTGTPGTGKTSVAEEMDHEVLDLTRFVKERGIGHEEEEFIVDVDRMVEELESELGDGEKVVEGHLSHHFPADYCVVLRCEPEELRERLKERGYSNTKIEENVQSEILDVVLSEAVEIQENIIEVDTTGREPGEVAEEVEKRIEEGDSGYGDVDWTDRI
ncbi:MAG: adenylate kinase family protein [Candidatus Nanohaloarchaea archaeon]